MFSVFQIVSYQLIYISKDPPTHGWIYLDHLDQFEISFKTFEKNPWKIPCFPENLVTGKILLRIRYDSYIGIFRPFGTISEVFEGSVIPCFPESVHVHGNLALVFL